MIKAVQVKIRPPTFGVLSLEKARQIDDSDRCKALDAAAYRFATSIRELEQQFEAKAAELRRSYLNEVEAAYVESNGS